MPWIPILLRFPMVNLAFAFEREEISAFRFDFTGNWESEGSFQYGNYNPEAEAFLCRETSCHGSCWT